MKKLFLFGAAAIAMLASCQKTEVNETQSTPIDDSTPVAMQFGVNAPSFQVTKTKAAVDAWASTPIQVIGLINEGTAAAPAYDFTDGIVFDQEAEVVNEDTKIALYQKNNAGEDYAGEEVPYFYAEGKLYDFYAYHLGEADAEAQVTGTNTITREVTISGSEDLMVAKPNKSQDIKADTSNDGVTTGDVYSAWAARRGVQPTLVFEHALTRFNFIVRGMDTPAENVTIDGISMTGLAKTGTLTVVGTELGFEAGTVVENDNTLVLKNSDDSAYTSEDVIIKNEVPAGQGSCLMVQPGLEKVHVKVDMHHTYQGKNNPVEIELDPYEFDVNASQVLKEGVAAGLVEFAAGTAYNIYINVYGPQEIIIKAELTEWADGGDYTYDPDKNRPGGEATSVTAERTVEDNVIKYTVTYSSDITAIQGAIATAQPDDDSDAWQTLVDTRAETGISFEVPEGENAENYKLWVRYTTETTSSTTTTWTTPAEPVKPAFEIKKSYLVVETEDSYNQLPEAYRAQYGEWKDYVAARDCTDATHDHSEFSSLPWLVVEVTPDSDIASITVENGDFTKEVCSNVHTTLGLIAISAYDLDLPFLTAGEWTITVNGIRRKITVDHNIKRAYFIEENEKSYNQIPEAYRAMDGRSWEAYKRVIDCVDGVKDCETDHNHETIQNHTDFDRLPWLAVDVVPYSECSVVVFNPSKEKVYENSVTAGSIGFMPLSAKKMNTELVAGTWRVVVNDMSVYIEVK